MSIYLPSDPRYYTQPTAAFVAAINQKFPDVASMGIYNRRPIAGTTTWSQHSWGNAVDITSPPSRGPKVPDNELHMAYLDNVYDWIRANWEALGVRVILWRRLNHYNHIHVDFYPRKTGTPPIITGPYVPEEDEFMRKGDSGERVKKVQVRLLLLGYQLPIYGADGDYGDETIAAVKAWQADRKLDVDGELRAIDITLLMENPHRGLRARVGDLMKRVRRLENA